MGLCYQRVSLLIFIDNSSRIKVKPKEHAKERKGGYFIKKNRLTVN